MNQPGTSDIDPNAPWYKQLNGYHWFVIIVASAAWFFDCLDQRLFSLARIPALSSLMNLPPSAPAVQNFGKEVTAWFLIGWGVGGMIFGALGDRYGRARMLTVTILIYSTFTGLSFFSRTPIDFTVARFLTGVGVGGVFGLAVALIAETVPSGARAQSLGLLQILSTIGNITAGLCKGLIDSLENGGTLEKGNGWRWMFLIGAVPALMVIFTGRKLKEPASWLALKEQGLLPKGGIFAPYAGLIGDARWRRNLIIGALIASTGVVGLWAIGEYAPDLQKSVFTAHYTRELTAAGKLTAETALTDAGKAMVKPFVDTAIFWAYLWNMIGAGVGMTIFTRLAGGMGRRGAFFLGFMATLVITFVVYWKLESPPGAYAMMFMLGAAQLSVFAGFAIYLPELFPSRLRSTGTSFCYNLGRFAAAAGSFFSATLSQKVYGHLPVPLPYRYSAMTMCVIFLVGLVTLIWAPETKGKPLPED
ncbi:MAG: MFS transporter [Verrucomicrobiaceae bacterium]|nr:MFS transporter [Verrucomicrobiaceae bacterium]